VVVDLDRLFGNPRRRLTHNFRIQFAFGRNNQFGDPDSNATDPSPGKGRGEGFGGGEGTGAGKGAGAGLGPGRGENTGGGDPKYGGGGPGGGGDGAPKPPKPEVDRNKAYTAKDVTRKAVITARPEPPYTEEARKNNIVGTVTVRVLLGGNGAVLQVVPLTRLPHGLTENALAAARRIRFTPAQKDGVSVSQWVQVEYSFNLY
jgi:TonB family protein